MKVSSVTLAGLAAISLGACSAPAAPASDLTSGDRSSEGGMTQQITFLCAPKPGAEVEEPDLICAELLDALKAARPDLRFAAGASGAPGVRFVITYATSRGLGLEATWTDAGGASTAGKPLMVSFFDRSSDATLRRNFYGTFLRENPIPF